MRNAAALALAVVVSLGAERAEDALGRARALYNGRQYDAAIAAAAEVRKDARLADVGNLVFARAHLERFRHTGDHADLTVAREALNAITPVRLLPRDRLELVVGWGEAMYLDDRHGAAAELFDSVLDRADEMGPGAHARVLDWWASAVERQAQPGTPAERDSLYARLRSRMEAALQRDLGSAVASYWLVVAAQGMGEFDRAWDTALAAWVRAALAGDRAADVRVDLDRLVQLSLVPERARRRAAPRDVAQVTTAMRADWEGFKSRWR